MKLRVRSHNEKRIRKLLQVPPIRNRIGEGRAQWSDHASGNDIACGKGCVARH